MGTRLQNGVEMAVPLIGIVDDDEVVRESTSSLIRSAGFRAALFPSTEAFLSSDGLHEMACLILDVDMPGLSGLALQRRLAVNGSIPIIFITALVDDQVRAMALRQGARAFMAKAFRPEVLLDAINSAVESSGQGIR